jgi:hypothetical protein
MPNHTKKVGYPGNHDSGEIMHQVDSQHHLTAPQSTVLFGSDMGGGSSGGAWIENFGVQAAGQTGGLQPWPNRVVLHRSQGTGQHNSKSGVHHHPQRRLPTPRRELLALLGLQQ